MMIIRDALGRKLVKHVDEFLDVVKRKTRGRLVKDVDRVLVGHAAQFAGQFQRWASPPDRVVAGCPSRM